MAVYILLGTLTDEGAERLRENPGWFEAVNQDLERMQIHVLAQYAVLGPYDIVTIVDAPDNRSIVKVSTQLTLRGNIRIVTLPALPVEDFLSSLR
jgi:uncharacterized protein with GYD domain